MAANVLESIDALFAGGKEIDDTKVDVKEEIQDEEIEASERPKTHANELDDLEKFIDDEMERQKTSIGMTWRKLAKCFKWQALKDHLVFHGIAPTDELHKKVEALLKSNGLTDSTLVEYNKEEKKIVRINHPDLMVLYQ